MRSINVYRDHWRKSVYVYCTCTSWQNSLVQKDLIVILVPFKVLEVVTSKSGLLTYTIKLLDDQNSFWQIIIQDTETCVHRLQLHWGEGWIRIRDASTLIIRRTTRSNRAPKTGFCPWIMSMITVHYITDTSREDLLLYHNRAFRPWFNLRIRHHRLV